VTENCKVKTTEVYLGTNPVQFPLRNLVAMQTSKNILTCINSFVYLQTNYTWNLLAEENFQEKWSDCYKNVARTLLGVDVTETTYHPSLSLSNKFNSNDTSYVNPSESLTVVKSLSRKHAAKLFSLVGDFFHSNILKIKK
jgi:hypothetical protein